MMARAVLRQALLGCLTVLLVALIAACDSPSRRQHAEFYVFGTSVLLRFQSSDTQASNVSREVGQLLQRRHRDWHAWESGALVTLNKSLANSRDAVADSSIISLIQAGQRYQVASRGLFDPGIGSLVALWGFHTSSYPVRTPAPTDTQIANYLQAPPSIAQLHVDGLTVHSNNAATQLDFGGLAKGAAANEVLALLRAQGVEHALLELGGDVSAISRAGSASWRVGIRDPGSSQALAGVLLRNGESLFTSGTYARYREGPGARAAHILDPRSGQPARGLRSASVLSSDALRADAAATTLIVAGRDWQQSARDFEVTEVLVIDEEDVCWTTQAMAERLIARSPAGERCRVVESRD